MYKYVDKEVEVGDVVIWCVFTNKDDFNLTVNKPYLVVSVKNACVNVIDDNGDVSSEICPLGMKIIKTKSGEEAKAGDTCVVTNRDNFEFGSIIEISNVSESFIYWDDNKCSNYKSLCVTLEKEEQKVTFEEYLVKNNIFDKFIYNTKSSNYTDKRKTISSSFFWVKTPKGNKFWYEHIQAAPYYDGSMDWICQHLEEPVEEDYFCIIFNSLDEIKEAIEFNVLDYDYGYRKGDINENNFPTIFKKCKSLGLSHQPNNGKENTWLKPEYKEWVKKSITWNKYKKKIIKDKEENRKQTTEQKLNNKCSANEKNSIIQLKTDFETSIEEPWIGIIYYESGSEHLFVRAKSEEELNKLFEQSCYRDMSMQKFQLKSIIKDIRKFIDTLV